MKQRLFGKKAWIGLLSIFVATLVACGAAIDDSTTSSLPGTGGTGIYATGQITGFGSIILSQLKFDDQHAIVHIDGVGSDPSDLRLGMVANVQGEFDAGQSKGTAKDIEVWSIAQGVMVPLSNSEIEVGNLRFSVDAATVLDGFNTIQTLPSSTRVRVWGIATDSAKGHWTATRVALADNQDWVTTGQVQFDASGGASVNGYLLPEALKRGLSPGKLVRVAVLINPSTGLPSVAVTDLTPGSPLHNLNAQVEGHVKEVLPGVFFFLDQVEVDASRATFYPGPFYLAPGMHVVVDGVWESGQLKATSITYRDASDLALVELSGKVQKFESLSRFYVRNTECDASVISNLDEATLKRLREGASVKVLGTKAGHAIKVYHLELI
jgi:hypothetical protein